MPAVLPTLLTLLTAAEAEALQQRIDEVTAEKLDAEASLVETNGASRLAGWLVLIWGRLHFKAV